MNKSDIEWTEYTWNPISGCLHGCPYCYARKQSLRFGGDVRLNMADERCKHWADSETLFVLDKPFISREDRSLSFPFGFSPTLHEYRMNVPQQHKKGCNIFVCSMADLFGEWVPDKWIDRVLAACDSAPQHNYMFLTKNPKRIYERVYSENMWLGRSVTNVKQAVALPTNDPENIDGFKANTFLSIEPLLEPVADYLKISIPYEKWVIIGAESGNRKEKVVPERRWIEDIVGLCVKNGIPVFMKSSLVPIWKDDLLQQYPAGLLRHQSPLTENRLYAHCSFCKSLQPRTELESLLSRTARHKSPVKLGFACPVCYKQLQEYISSDVPCKGFGERGVEYLEECADGD